MKKEEFLKKSKRVIEDYKNNKIGRAETRYCIRGLINLFKLKY